jgi:hypothetical protein
MMLMMPVMRRTMTLTRAKTSNQRLSENQTKIEQRGRQDKPWQPWACEARFEIQSPGLFLGVKDSPPKPDARICYFLLRRKYLRERGGGVASSPIYPQPDRRSPYCPPPACGIVQGP